MRLEVFELDPKKPNELIDIFEERLIRAGMQSSSPRYHPLENTINHLISLHPRCVIIQHDVQDPDFLAEHEAYYSRWTTRVSRYCERLHFFKERASSQDPIPVIDQMSEIEGSYLGFITLRPISMSPVAATILPPNVHANNHFILSKDKFPVNLAGKRFYVTGTPFMQQDNAVGACAQASIWMALRTLRKKEGRSAFNPSQITTAATRFLVQGRTLPNRNGLSIDQIAEAIRTAGYATNIIPFPNAGNTDIDRLNYLKSSIYPYVESGIPVLLALTPSNSGGHAVLLIGHGWTENPNRIIKLFNIKNDRWISDLEIYDAASWVEPFYIHNDNTGPYIPLYENSVDDYCLAHVASAIPFLPDDVFVDAEEARLTSIKLLNDMLSNLMGNGDKYEIPKIVSRLYLMERSSFRESIVDSDMSDEVKSYYRMKWIPRRVWVMELNMYTGYSKCSEGEAVRIGEILLDPSSEAEDGAFLSIHLAKCLLPPEAGVSIIIDRDAISGEIKAFPVNDNNYSVLIR